MSLDVKAISSNVLADLNFFDNMMALVPVHRKNDEVSLNTKFLFKRDGFNASATKVTAATKRVREERAQKKADTAAKLEKKADMSDDDHSEDENVLIVPGHLGSIEELRAKLKAKVDSSRSTSEAGEGKRQKRKELEKKKKDKKDKQKQKARQGDKEKKLREQQAAEEPVAKKAKTTEEPRSPHEVQKIVIDPSKIKADFMFGTVASSVESKDMTRVNELTNQKGRFNKNNSTASNLKKVSDFKSKVQKLEQSGDVEGAEKLKLQSSVSAAVARASGETIKDNEKMLKKSMKRDLKKKEKSASEWDARKKLVEKQQKERIAKRTENINKKAQIKRDIRNGKGKPKNNKKK